MIYEFIMRKGKEDIRSVFVFSRSPDRARQDKVVKLFRDEGYRFWKRSDIPIWVYLSVFFSTNLVGRVVKGKDKWRKI